MISMRYLGFLAIFIILAAAALVSGEESCDEDNWEMCKEQLFLLKENYSVEDYLEGDMQLFCRAVEQNGSCWNDVSMPCKEKYPHLATDFAAYFVNKNLFCNPDGDYVTMHKKVSECVSNYVESDMERCFPKLSEEDSPSLSSLCRNSVNFFYCIADIGKRHCGEEGDIFGNAYQTSIRDAYATTCDVDTILTTATEHSTSI